MFAQLNFQNIRPTVLKGDFSNHLCVTEYVVISIAHYILLSPVGGGRSGKGLEWGEVGWNEAVMGLGLGATCARSQPLSCT